MDFIHGNFSKFILHSPTRIFEGDSEARQNLLTELVLRLLRVNGTPLIDVSLDISPTNSSRFVGVVRVPQRSGLLPRLVRSSKDAAVFNRWVRTILNKLCEAA